MKIAYTSNLRLGKANIARLEEVNDILEDYASQGYILTLRQLYYQLVSQDIIPNSDKEYKNLSLLLGKGRMAGVVDWDGIEDRLRVPYIPYWSNRLKNALRDLKQQYRRNRQEDQPTYIEVWCEKDALSGILKKVTSHYHVRLMVNRGYSSITAMHDAFERFKDHAWENGTPNVKILYLGDHDPSGMDMIRDIEERINEFIDGFKEQDNDFYILNDNGNVNFEIESIALTTAQVRQYKPPPNPAKITDPRAKWYIAEHGNVSWEVDALPPNVLDKLLRSSIEDEMDMVIFQNKLDEEAGDIARLQRIIDEEV